jgi:hypothetical protein
MFIPISSLSEGEAVYLERPKVTVWGKCFIGNPRGSWRGESARMQRQVTADAGSALARADSIGSPDFVFMSRTENMTFRAFRRQPALATPRQ